MRRPRRAQRAVGVYLVLGRRGMGKTTYMRRFIGELLADGRQIVLIHDERGQFEGHRWRSVEEFRGARKLPPVNVFRGVSPGEVAALAVQLAERRVRVVLVIDELDLACDSNRFHDEPARKRGEAPRRGNLYSIVHYGRHIGRPDGDERPIYGVDLVGSARRPTNVHVDVGELAEQIVCFRLNGRNALAWVEETCGDEFAGRVATLPKFRSVTYDPADTSDVDEPPVKSANRQARGRRVTGERNTTNRRNRPWVI
jgi:GTPase SAR1 family protein